MSGHTPGPWMVDGEQVASQTMNVVGYFVGVERNGRVGQSFVNCMVDDRTALANARLIAAAPEMLGALRECAKTLEDAYENWHAEIVRALIARIEGDKA